MLRGISPLLSPELLAVLYRMGHGDEIVLADGHFPGESFNTRVLRADGIRIAPLLDAILPLFVLDPYVSDPVLMMAPVVGDQLDQDLLTSYRYAIARHAPETPETAFLERFAFYERVKNCFAVIATGERRLYGNLILKKGIVRPD